jgi:hypothetical protein
MVSG